MLGVRAVPDQDWVRLTQSQFEPVQITPDFWIVPSWHEVPGQARQVIDVASQLIDSAYLAGQPAEIVAEAMDRFERLVSGTSGGTRAGFTRGSISHLTSSRGPKRTCSIAR